MFLESQHSICNVVPRPKKRGPTYADMACSHQILIIHQVGPLYIKYHSLRQANLVTMWDTMED